MSASQSDFIKLEESIQEGVINEGKAKISIPPGKNVFYNPVQTFNRDISVLVLQTFSKELQLKSNGDVHLEKNPPFRILEALSASGLRSIRYAKEVSGVTEVVANDICSDAIQIIETNIKDNGVQDIVKKSHANAVTVMYNNIHPTQRFQVVDLDPYGCPTVFLDSAVQCVADGGLLLVTCTDMAVLCGVSPETCYVKYGCLPLKLKCQHEMAIRIALQCIQSHASKYKRYIVPVLSISADFYIRVFVRIFTSPSACKRVPSKLSMMFHCTGCGSITLQPLIIAKEKENSNVVKYSHPRAPSVGTQCIHCGSNHHMGGPIWSAPIHDQNFVTSMLNSKEIHEFSTSKRLLGMLSVIREELNDVPLYYDTTQLCSNVKLSTIPMLLLRSAILNAGYRVSYSHACKVSLKTDAPMAFIFDVLRAWIKENSLEPRNIVPGSPGDIILKTQNQSEIDFSLRPDANPLSREMKLTRYQENPMPFWGPGTKSTSNNITNRLNDLKNKKKKEKFKRKIRKGSHDADKESKNPRIEEV